MTHLSIASRSPLLFGTQLLIAVFLSQIVSSSRDPRCANVVCDLSRTDPSTYAFDASECDSEYRCPQQCLGGEDYAALLQSLGTGSAVRNRPLWTTLANWLSAQIPSQIFKILAMEVMGYKVRSAQVTHGSTVLCCDETILWLENWPNDPFPDDLVQGSFHKLPVGYVGFAGLWIPEYTLQNHPFATAYNSYKVLPEYQTLFPAAFSTPCNETLMDASAGCVDSNRYCSESVGIWTNTTCVDGRYVPPQCVGNQDCQEVLYNEPVWDPGFFEAVTKNLGLNLTFVYVGINNLYDVIKRYAAAERNFVFYMSGPDPILAAVPSWQINFPPRMLWCDEQENVDPTLSGGNCTYDNAILYKTARRTDIAADPDLKRLFDAFHLSLASLQALMAQHVDGGGTENLWNVSCGWVRNNVNVWKSWVVNTPPVTPVATSNTAIFGVIGVAGVVIIGGVVYVLRMRHLAKTQTKNAPTTAPLALIFTDVESSTNLWEAYPEMAQAMEMHHALIRQVIEEYECYEVKTIGDSFMIACPTIAEAVGLSIAIQRKLFEAKWPAALRYWKGDEDTMPGMWNGLRVRIGVHWCTEVQPQLDSVHGRYDYYGHDVNVSARVESLAAGGQILMSADTYQVLAEHEDFPLLCEEMQCVPFCKGAELKGVQGTISLFAAAPIELSGRRFKAIEGTQPVDVLDDLDRATSAGSIAQSIAPETGSAHVATKKFLEDVFSHFGAKERDRVVAEVMLKAKLIANISEASTVKYQRKVQMLTRYVIDNAAGASTQMAAPSSFRRLPSGDFVRSLNISSHPNVNKSDAVVAVTPNNSAGKAALYSPNSSVNRKYRNVGET